MTGRALRTVAGFGLLLGGIALLVFVGSLVPPSRLALALGACAIALGAAGLRLLWQPTGRA